MALLLPVTPGLMPNRKTEIGETDNGHKVGFGTDELPEEGKHVEVTTAKWVLVCSS